MKTIKLSSGCATCWVVEVYNYKQNINALGGLLGNALGCLLGVSLVNAGSRGDMMGCLLGRSLSGALG